MARWILLSPRTNAPSSEQRVANLLDRLGPGFSIRWGFFYAEGQNTLFREGDFIVQGPDGHVLVMEVKSGQPSCDPSTGLWNVGEGNNPFFQLDAEAKGVINQLTKFAEEAKLRPPFIDRVLALPDLHLAPDVAFYQGVQRSRIAAKGDLENFAKWWTERFAGRHLQCTIKQARQIFEGVYAIGAPATDSRHVLDFADEVIEMQTGCTFDLLDAMSENQQLLFCGGPGTGKTWLAIEQAGRWADAGKRVLVLCYNLELEVWLQKVCHKRNRSITVWSYQTLGEKLLGKPHPASWPSRAESTEYFDTILPGELHRRIQDPSFTPLFDALVVDEAQDHNTSPSLNGVSPGGWWAIYLALLEEGCNAPLAAFFDPSQRLVLRAGTFDPAQLRDTLLQPVVVRVSTPLRFTRPLLEYYRTLECEFTRQMLRDLKPTRVHLPEGATPELFPDTCEQDEGLQCARLINKWLERGVVRPHEVLVLHPSSTRPGWLPESGVLDGLRFYSGGKHSCPGNAIRAVSINKAKGLDSRAIVLVGMDDWADASQDEHRAKTFVLGVTRARQLLAVFSRPKKGG